MLQGTIVENSLNNTDILNELHILKSWSEGDWNLHQVELYEEDVLRLSEYIKDGPWYMHFWFPNKDDVIVVYKKKTFKIKHSEKSTWMGAVSYGRSIGIPEEQLDFLIN